MPFQVFRWSGNEEILLQGDLFDHTLSPEEFLGVTDLPEFRVLVLDHECQIEKQKTTGVICATVFLLARLGPGIQGHIRAGRVHHTMYLPPYGDLPEQYADLRYQARLGKTTLEKAKRDGRRLCSMTDEGRFALLESIYRYYARQPHNE